jgi:hypothetical protein
LFPLRPIPHLKAIDMDTACPAACSGFIVAADDEIWPPSHRPKHFPNIFSPRVSFGPTALQDNRRALLVTARMATTPVMHPVAPRPRGGACVGVLTFMAPARHARPGLCGRAAARAACPEIPPEH